jgi:hypothetical protein
LRRDLFLKGQQQILIRQFSGRHLTKAQKRAFPAPFEIQQLLPEFRQFLCRRGHAFGGGEDRRGQSRDLRRR